MSVNHIGIENEFTVFLRNEDVVVSLGNILAQRLQKPIGANSKFFIIGEGSEKLTRGSGHASLWLANGGKIYADLGHLLEYASPECLGVNDIVLSEKAGDIIA